MWKHENLEQHNKTWRINGVNHVNFQWISTRQINPYVSVIRVELLASQDPQAQKQEPAENFSR